MAELDDAPLALPVTVTCTICADENVHDNMADPDVPRVTLPGLTVHDVLLVVRLTVPVKPFWDVTVMVDVPAVPGLTVILVGLAVTVNPGTPPAL